MVTAARALATLPVPAQVLALEQQARRETTPCGAGDMVWHTWGTPRDGVPPLVLLHGGSGSWTHWVRNIADLVDAGRELWIPDLPGFGDSASPASGGDADALGRAEWPRACARCSARASATWWASRSEA